MARVFVLFDQYGKIVGDTDTVDEAVAAAEDLGAGEVFLDQTARDETGDDFTENKQETDADWAWKLLPRLPPLPGYPMVQRPGEPLRIDPEVVENMSLEEAWERLLLLMPTYKGKTRENVSSPTLMRKWLMGVNEKTNMREMQRRIDKYAEAVGEEPDPKLIKRLLTVSISGLSLMPAGFWYQTYRGADSIVEHNGRKMPVSQWLRGEGLHTVNLCAGSSPECRSSCLVGSGRNEADPWNVMVKIAKTSAFMLDPEAFMVMLMHNISFRTEQSEKAGYRQFVRLNVYQDVPWELVFPELFDFHSSVQFYDYTKVSRRVTPENYDLTFSYSGRNMALTVDEMKAGRRVAAVFALDRHVYPREVHWGPGIEVLQGREPVLADTIKVECFDGDLSDVRPFDPAPSLIALSYKPPMIKEGTAEERMERAVTGESATGVGIRKVERPPYFIVPASPMQFVTADGKIRNQGYVMALTPKSEPTDITTASDDEKLDGTYGGAISAEKRKLPVLK